MPLNFENVDEGSVEASHSLKVMQEVLTHVSVPVSFLTPELITAPASWLGHTPFALWIVDALRPKTLVELGTHTGNSYAAFCQAVKGLALGSACFAVDTWQGDPQAGYYGDEVYRTFSTYHDPRYGAFSRLMRMTFDEAVQHFADGSIDLLHIDGLHTYEAVRHDFETWLPRMSRRGIILFHDINVRKDDFGVWRLWEEVSRDRPSFGFLHSNGLGVLGVGDELPGPMRWLFDAQVEGGARLHAVRSFFDRLGGGVIETQQAAERAEQIVGLTREIAELHNTVRGRVDEIRDLMATVAARDHDIATLQGLQSEHQSIIAALSEDLSRSGATVAERDRDIAIIQGWVAEQSAKLAEREDEIRKRDNDVAMLHAELHAEIARREDVVTVLHGEIENLRAGVAVLQGMVAALYASTSWKISAPVRRLSRLVQAVRRLYRSRAHVMTLTPLQDVAAKGDGFVSTGVDPAFLLTSDQRRVPSGWCLVSYRIVHTSVPLAPRLYIDIGSGFGEHNVIRLPPALSGVVEALVVLPSGAKALRFDPTDRAGTFAVTDLGITEIGKLQVLARATRRYRGRVLRGLSYMRLYGLAAVKQKILRDLLPVDTAADYDTWVGLYDTLTAADREAIADDVARMTSRPLISIIMPVYNTPEPYLRRALDTVLDQLYPNWELCIADDASKLPHVAEVLAEYAARDTRVKVVRREHNGHISAASNTALEIAKGEFIALMDHDDELPAHALYLAAREIVCYPDVDVIYSDEDKIDENGRRYDPYFKSDWNPDLFHGQNMVSHLGVFRRTLLTAVHGFRVGYEGSQDYDLVLRAVEKTNGARIRHIPHILYHWRVFSSSSSFSTVALPTATDAARRALQDHFDRVGLAATVGPAPGAEWYSRITYPLPDPAPMVSLLVPTRDKVELLRQCVEGLLGETDYPNLEVLVLDNNSQEAETLAYFAELEGRARVRVLSYDGPFNFSAVNNFGVRHARGEILGLINNDIKVIEPGWLSEMVRHAIRSEVGAVGAKLYYADDTIQHAGVVTGINGVANHIHKHLPREHPGYFGRLRLVQNMTCVTAACLLMRRSVYDEVGGLDEANLAVAFNDIDLCLRVREKGYLVVWTPFAELYHLESASRGSDMAPDKIARFTREIRHMHDRWGTTLTNDPYYNPNLTLDDVNFALAFPPRTEKPWLDRTVPAVGPKAKDDVVVVSAASAAAALNSVGPDVGVVTEEIAALDVKTIDRASQGDPGRGSDLER